MAMFLYGCVAFQYHPRTPLGVQCPTATVQEVLEPVTCCGKVVRYEKRAPKPGDDVFVQCSCAEKKSADHLASAAVPVLQCFYLPVVLVTPQAFLEPYQDPWTTLPSESTITTPPLVPPPNLA